MARVRVRHSADVTIRTSDLSRCRVICLRADNSARLTILDTQFHDCHGCDFLLAWGVETMRIARNRFERAVPGSCGIGGKCNHQDLVQLVSGTDWLIEGNHFGLSYGGAAQVYLSGSAGETDRVTIRGNTFVAGDPAYPDLIADTGIVVGNPPYSRGLPTNVTVEENDIQSGAPRLLQAWWIGVANSLIVSEAYQALPDELRPLVQNNLYATLTHPEFCDLNARGGVCGRRTP